MHHRDTIELAAVITSLSDDLHESSISVATVDEYWLASQRRIDAWHDSMTCGGEPLVAVCEEVLATEVLTHVWAAVLATHDRGGSRERLGKRVLDDHRRVRMLVLRELLEGAHVSRHEALSLNRFASRADGWSDRLVGYLAASAEVAHLAPHPERAARLADAIATSSDLPATTAWALVEQSLRRSFRPCRCTLSPSDIFNEQIAASIRPCLPIEVSC
jgi:hypothetical protein